ncbi:MAG: ABC transporter permease [Acidobacteria bacterium]|nr:ABC transporter permease [Acidobacteriota bacterium]
MALRRLVHAAIALVGISFVVFFLVHAAPGDPVQLRLGGVDARHVTPEVIAALRAEMRLDDPILVRYGAWLVAAARFDFGDSFVARAPVRRLLARRLPGTLLLVATALVLAIILAVPLGMAGARYSGKGADIAGAIGATAIYSIPTFWLALILLQIFAVKLGVLPLFGMPSHDATGPAWLLALARHMVLPVATLALGPIAYLSRFVRASMLDSSGREFMRTARAKGLSEWGALIRHGLRNAMPPVVSLLSVAVPALLSACVVVERIFRWEGIGNLFVESVVARDYPVVMALTLLTAVLSLAAGALADLLLLLLDPRARTEENA